MERDFYNEEFEDLIREKTDHYKMYPSDKAWKEIYNSLHSRRRRYMIGMSVLISGILIFAGRELLVPGKHPVNLKPAENIAAATPKAPAEEPEIGISAFKKDAYAHSSIIQPLDIIQPEQADQQPVIGFNEVMKAGEETLQPMAENTQPGIDPEFRLSMANIVREPAGLVNAPMSLDLSSPESGSDEAARQINDSRNEALLNLDSKDKDQLDWLQERALQHLTPPRQHNLKWQFYFSPTVNYRQLSGGIYADSRSTVQNVPISLNHYGSANDFVDHTPAVGLEAGGAIMYRLTRNLSVKAGLQFNYSRYFIRAYSSTPELATIALNSYYGNFADSITAFTSVRNFSGKSTEFIQNKYFQISLPVGLEMRVLGNGKLQLHIAGTLQPTYLLNRNSYLLTTDYTNYTKEPTLFRQWNLNAGAEAFITYQIGGMQWQIGPQFRYQLFSTYTDKYPLRENLMEYGIKLGISKNIR